MLWLFNRASVSPADSFVSMVNFHSQMLCGCFFLAVVLWAGELGLGSNSILLKGEPLQMSYPSGNSAASPGSGASPFCISALPTNLDVASSINPWL